MVKARKARKALDATLSEMIAGHGLYWVRSAIFDLKHGNNELALQDLEIIRDKFYMIIAEEQDK